jgi:hypothetical protein
LAKAQVSWLGASELKAGPRPRRQGGVLGDDGVLDDATTAANAGKLVVAGYFQPPTQQHDGSQTQRAGHMVANDNDLIRSPPIPA